MAQNFKKGDIVQLNSGGPKMTIEKYKMIMGYDFTKESEDLVICTWFDHNGELQTREFEQEALSLVNDE